MLVNVNTLRGYRLSGLDGTIGDVKECYFDDHHWAVRYLVADTRNWLTGRAVLISPHAISGLNSDARTISVELTKKQIEDSPSLNTDVPVSRQFEQAYYGHYGWPEYWGGPYMWGAYPNIQHDRSKLSAAIYGTNPPDLHLRSSHDLTGHHIQATDGEIGHVVDFILDDQSWALRYLVVDTSNWWPGKKVLISALWIDRVSWEENKVFTSLSRSAVKLSPEYTAGSPPTRHYETVLHRHYDRPRYWEVNTVAK